MTAVSGFTFVKFLIVVSVIPIPAGILPPELNAAREKADENSGKSEKQYRTDAAEHHRRIRNGMVR